MPVINLHDKTVLEGFFRNNPELHIYSIGDLDDFFWPYTTWFAKRSDTGLEAVALLYTGQPLPTLLALTDHSGEMSDLLESIAHILPHQFYAHLSPGLEKHFKDSYRTESHGEHYKMALRNMSEVDKIDCAQAKQLNISDLNDILSLYETAYPGNWFDQRMLGTGQYYGIRKDEELVSVAGIHVYSEAYGVAALGNITTNPDYRGRGYGTTVTARVVRSLAEKTDHIGLNVKADNASAISCYRKLGFEIIASYGEYMFRRV